MSEYGLHSLIIFLSTATEHAAMAKIARIFIEKYGFVHCTQASNSVDIGSGNCPVRLVQFSNALHAKTATLTGNQQLLTAIWRIRPNITDIFLID